MTWTAFTAFNADIAFQTFVTPVTTCTERDGNRGLDNGVPVSFTAVAVDNGATALDTFSIVLSDGYRNAGHLLGGTITLH